jgi:hypothetical protein
VTEPRVYRPFALVAFGGTVLAGTPVGVGLLGWRQLGVPALTADWLHFHAGIQVFSLLGTLIVGVAHHLLPRFTGRPVAATALTPWLALLLAGGLALRMAAVTMGAGAVAAAGALAQAAAFTLFAGWVWRALDPPPLARLRRHLTLASAWPAAAAALEAVLRVVALADGLATPPLDAMRAVHSMALLGGVIGWVSGVLLRAGPMFVAGWRVPTAVAVLAGAGPAVAGVLSAATLIAAPAAAGRLARLADLVALGAVATLVVSAGALRRAGRALPMLSRSAAESRIFRLGVACALLATLGAAVLALAALGLVPGGVGVALAPGGAVAHALLDALRHLVAVGFLTSVVVAMTFRLIPVLEATALPWPRLRDVALAALLGAVVARSAQALASEGRWWLAPAVVLSGVLAWIALACPAASLLAAVLRRRPIA